MSLSTQLPTVPRSRQGHRGTPAFAGQWTVARLKAWLALRPYAQPNKALSCANVSPTRHGIGSGARSARASISVASNVKMVSVVIHGASIRARLRQLLGPPPGHRGGSPVRAVAGPGLSYHSYRTTREPLARRNAAAGCYHPARRPECPSMRPPPASPCGHSGARVCGRAGRRPPPSSDKIGEGMHRRGLGPRPTASVLAGACPSVRHQDPGWPPVKLLRLGLRLVKIAAEHSPSGKVTTHV